MLITMATLRDSQFDLEITNVPAINIRFEFNRLLALFRNAKVQKEPPDRPIRSRSKKRKRSSRICVQRQATSSRIISSSRSSRGCAHRSRSRWTGRTMTAHVGFYAFVGPGCGEKDKAVTKTHHA